MNTIKLKGEVLNTPIYSHDVPNEKMYTFKIACKRTSGVADTLNCQIPELFIKDVEKGKTISIEGEIRTRNVAVEGSDKVRLELYMFIMNEPIVCEKEEPHVNNVFVDGVICKNTQCRTTLLGRDITDFLVASNRKYGKSDYIPCLAWGRNAHIVQNYQIGTRVELKGRLQSREYTKKINENESENRVTYEMSVLAIKVVEE